MDINFQDLEAETIHVCIAWALLNIWVVLFCLFYYLHFFWSIFPLLSLLWIVSLYIGSGLGETRYSLLTLPPGVWLVGSGASETIGLWSCFCFEIDILGGALAVCGS